MVISFKNLQKATAYVRKPAESILSTRKPATPIQAEAFKYAGAKAQEQMPYVFKIHNTALKKLYLEEKGKWTDAVRNLEACDLKGLPSTANFNEKELKKLYLHLKHQHDTEAFTFVALGARPAMASVYSPLFSKIKSPNFDNLICDYKYGAVNFVFNKKAAFENIHRNKDFYTQRLNLAKTASEEEIYKILTGENSPLKNHNNCDFIGMIMGFPRKDNLVFKLEWDAGLHPDLRKNPQKLKEALLKELNFSNCVYGKFDEPLKKELEGAIKSISSIKHRDELGLPHGYTFINYVDDAPEIVRINKKIREAIPKLEEINAANQKAKEDEYISQQSVWKQYFLNYIKNRYS